MGLVPAGEDGCEARFGHDKTSNCCSGGRAAAERAQSLWREQSRVTHTSLAPDKLVLSRACLKSDLDSSGPLSFSRVTISERASLAVLSSEPWNSGDCFQI